MNPIERFFPNLASGKYRITSEKTLSYNCIAWAAGESTRKWWPAVFAFWPRGARRAVTLEAFVEAFGTLGYAKAADGSLEKGIEKVAIYVDAKEAPKHAARQLPSGKWTSKLGDLEDIEHDLDGVEGSAYGRVACFLARPRS